jgi:hypothetical protein
MDGENELLYTFNKILLDKRDEIIEIANNKKRGGTDKKMTDVNKLNKDISTTLTRIHTENEKKIKNSARYKKKEEI